MKSCVLVKISKQFLSFWYQIEGGDFTALSIKEGNVVPLCFYVNCNDFKVGSFAKERCLVNDPNSYKDYFETIKNYANIFVLHGDSKPVKQLLYYGIENYLSHFIKTILYKNESIEAYRKDFCLRFWFDEDIENHERILVINLFKEAGYENVDSINIDYHINEQINLISDKKKTRILLTAISNDLFIKLFSVNQICIDHHKLENLGSDPRAKIIAKLILEDIKEAYPYFQINEDVEIGYIINHCSHLLSYLTPLMRNEIILSTGIKTDYKIRLCHVEERLMYYRDIEDKIIPKINTIISTNGLSNSSIDIILCGDELNTSYFKEKLNKKFPVVLGVPSSIESKLLKSIFVHIAINQYQIQTPFAPVPSENKNETNKDFNNHTLNSPPEIKIPPPPPPKSKNNVPIPPPPPIPKSKNNIPIPPPPVPKSKNKISPSPPPPPPPPKSKNNVTIPLPPPPPPITK
jgi:hypothetical protein